MHIYVAGWERGWAKINKKLANFADDITLFSDYQF